MKTQKFGIEIEMTGITRKKATEIITQYFETTFVYAGGTYDAYEIRDKKGAYLEMYERYIYCLPEKDSRR